MADISLIVGSVHGTTEDLAEELQHHLIDNGHSVAYYKNPKLAEVADYNGTLIVCTSTAGFGEPPGNLSGFYRKLKTKRPDLRSLYFAVIALGDRAFAERFCMAGLLFDTLLAELGAQRQAPPLLIDVQESQYPKKAAIPWLNYVLGAV